MSKLNSEVNRLNDDSEFIEFLTNEEEYEIENQSIYDHGFSQGIEQGSFNEKIAIAKNMLMNNMDVETIVKLTGISKEEVEKLSNI